MQYLCKTLCLKDPKREENGDKMLRCEQTTLKCNLRKETKKTSAFTIQERLVNAKEWPKTCTIGSIRARQCSKTLNIVQSFKKNWTQMSSVAYFCAFLKN